MMLGEKLFLSAFYISLLLATNYVDWTLAFPGHHDDDDYSGLGQLLIFGAVAGMLG